MAQFPLSDLLDGSKSLATKIYNSVGELFTISNPAFVQLSGSNVQIPVKPERKSSIATIANAITVSAGGNSGPISLGIEGTETNVFIAVNVDQQPWDIDASVPFNSTAGTVKYLYPQRSGVTKTFTNANLPAISLILGIAPDNHDMPAINSMAEALLYSFPVISQRIIFYNKSATNATVTIKTIKIW